jgi:N-acetylglucosamine-6-phosphate deacetylase
MTVAPELDGAAELIAYLLSRGVIVSAGHTDATSQQAHAAFDLGVRMVTHLWNAQRQITSREPALAGAALSRPDVFVGVIADGVHLARETLVLTMAAAGERAVVVTDAASAAGLPDGEHVLDGRTVIVRDGGVRLPNGTLAGSAFGMDALVRNMVACGLTTERALDAVTTAPAAVLGRTDVGALAVGARADVVVLTDDLTIADVLVAGHSA